MRRTMKNVIMVTVLILAIAGLCFTCLTSGKGRMPAQFGEWDGNMGEAPAMPDGEWDGDMDTPPNMPDGEWGGDMGTPPDMPSGDRGGNIGERPGMPSVSILRYVILGIEALVISAMILYLLMSLFNKKTFKETFETGTKVIIAILSVVLLTGVITFAAGYATQGPAPNGLQRPEGMPDFDGMGGENNFGTLPNKSVEEQP